MLPVLKQVYQLNLYFQKTNIDYHKAFTDVSNSIWTFARQILRPTLINYLCTSNNFEELENSMQFATNYLAVENCDLGYHFEQEVGELEMRK